MIADYPTDAQTVDGGVQAATLYLVNGLLRSNAIDLHLVSFRPDITDSTTTTVGGFTHHLLRRHRLGSLTRWRRDYRALSSCLEKIQPDLVHAQGAGVDGYLAVRSGFPSVVTFHGILRIDARFKSRARDRWRLAFESRVTENYCAAHADHAILISEYVERVFGARLRAVGHHIPNATSPRYFSLRRNDQTPTILFAGRLIPIKGLDTLIRAFAALQLLIPAKLVLAGSTKDTAHTGYLKKLAEEAGVSDRVIFAGLLDEPALLEQFEGASVLALPSRQENAPMVIQQAMAAGLPVVASSVGGIPAMIRHGVDGFLVPPGDVDNLAASLRKLLGDSSLRAQMSQACREHSYRFTADVVARQTIRVYEQAVASARSPSPEPQSSTTVRLP